MEATSETNSNNGWGAWKNVRKENELLKTKLLVEQENKFGVKMKVNNGGNIVPVNNIDNPFRFSNANFTTENKEKEKDEDEDEEIIMCKNRITKKKIQIKELISISSSKKKEYEEKSEQILDEYNKFVLSNEADIEKIMKQIEIYNSIISENSKTVKTISPSQSKNQNPSENIELFIGSLPPFYKEKELKSLFSTYGEITRCVVLSTGIESKCCGFVTFKTTQSAFNAIDCLNGTTPDNFTRPILVEYSNTKKKC